MEVGEQLGSYRIEGTLGVGAMGVVYRATHLPTQKPAAVKVVNNEVAARGKAYERFKREADILQQFRHPNIVRFFAVGRYQGTSYIAMEFIQGRTLEQILEERGEMPWQEVVDLAIQMCDALHYAHEHGVVHRDLKPSNLMITEDGRVKLTDFGIAKDLDKTALTATGRTLGTAAYMAPEQIRGTPGVSHKTDLYALGCVLFQMLTGEAPFSGGTHIVLMHNHLNSEPPRVSSKAEVPKALDELVNKLMAKEPSDRPWDAASVGVSLTDIRDRPKKDAAKPRPADETMAASASLVSDMTAKRPRKKRRTAPAAGSSAQEGESNRLLGTVGLVAALALVGGIIGYIVWPPGQRYLYTQAGALMASTQKHDWLEARDRYLEPLDRRFPSNPYKKETQAWRDRIHIADIEGRAKMIQAVEAGTSFNEPKNDVERRWVAYFTKVLASRKANDDVSALQAWNDLAQSYRPEDNAERGWYLLALRNAADLKAAMADRRKLVNGLLVDAKHAELQGDAARARELRNEIYERYARYTDLADLLPRAMPPDAPAGAPTSAGPSQTETVTTPPEKPGD